MTLGDAIGVLPICVIRSPGCSPAASAGPPDTTSVTSAPPPPAAAKLVVSAPSHAAPVVLGANVRTPVVGPLPPDPTVVHTTAKAAAALSSAAATIREVRSGRFARIASTR